MTAGRTDPDRAFADRPPIVLIGSQRSGTTFLGDIFRAEPTIAYWEEPRHVWTRGNAYTRDDRLDTSHARPGVRSHIRTTFADFAGDRRFCEKTPSNCLRIPFIRAVLPEARLLLILRDGRAVLRSTGEIMQQGVSTNRVIQRAKETPLTEWPAFFGQAVGTVARRITKKPLKYWGMRPPGWKGWIGMPRTELLAHQWAGAITQALDDADALGSGQIHTFRYEDLMADPARVMRGVTDFIGLESPGEIIERVASKCDASRTDKWRDELDAAELDRVRPVLEPVLNRMGYQW